MIFSIPVHTPIHTWAWQNIHLRLRMPSDAEQIFNLIDRNRERFRKGLTWLDNHRDVSDTLRFIEKCAADCRNRRNTFDLGIWIEGTGFVGSIGFHTWDQKKQSASIGYWISDEFEGRGIIRRSAATLITYGFGAMNLNRVWIQCTLENTRSMKIPEALNMRNTGRKRGGVWMYNRMIEALIFSIQRKDWRHPEFCA